MRLVLRLINLKMAVKWFHCVVNHTRVRFKKSQWRLFREWSTYDHQEIRSSCCWQTWQMPKLNTFLSFSMQSRRQSLFSVSFTELRKELGVPVGAVRTLSDSGRGSCRGTTQPECKIPAEIEPVLVRSWAVLSTSTQLLSCDRTVLWFLKLLFSVLEPKHSCSYARCWKYQLVWTPIICWCTKKRL